MRVLFGLIKSSAYVNILFMDRFWYLKLYALTAVRDFEGLDTFAKSKRSPIGYEIFVRHLIEKGHPKEATSYVSKCDSPKRADLYADCGEWNMAGKECKDRGDRAKLEYVYISPVRKFKSDYPIRRELKKRCPNNLILRDLEHIASTMK